MYRIINLDKNSPTNYVRIDKDENGHAHMKFSATQDEATVFKDLPAAAIWIEVLRSLRYDLRIEGT